MTDGIEREILNALRIETIDRLPGQVETYRVKLKDVDGAVTVDATKLNNRHLFNEQCIIQLGRSFPLLSGGKWNEEVDKSLRVAPYPAPPEMERMHRYGTASWGSEETPWLVHNRIPERGYGSLVGATSTYKSFQLVEMAGCIITGMDYLKAPVRRRGGVLILAPEGAYDI